MFGIGFFGQTLKEDYKKGQEISVLIDSQPTVAKILDVTSQSFYKMYFLEFEDGSKAWLNSKILSEKLN